MVRLKWDQVGERQYETGTSKGVLYPLNTETGAYSNGVAWDGLVSVKKAPDGAEPTPLYANDQKYLELMSAENLKGTIEAFTYPEEFEACDGSAAVSPGVYVGQQTRVPFALAYSTILGNDSKGTSFSEKIHLIYGAKASPTSRDYSTVNNDPNALTFSWAYTTTPVDLSDIGMQASAGIVIVKHEVGDVKFKELQDTLYGTETLQPSIPTLQEVIAMMEPVTPVTP